MELQNLLELRRSIRAYKDQPVDRTCIEEMVEAAQMAASWKNSQTGRYYVAMEPALVAHVKETCMPEFNQNNTKNAPVIMVQTFVKDRSGFDRDGSPANEPGNEWGAYDLGLQTANLMFKATELGLGTLIMGLRDEALLRKEFAIPDEEEVMAVISVGYPDCEPAAPKRKELDQVLKFF